jgi:hypothetical protein
MESDRNAPVGQRPGQRLYLPQTVIVSDATGQFKVGSHTLCFLDTITGDNRGVQNFISDLSRHSPVTSRPIRGQRDRLPSVHYPASRLALSFIPFILYLTDINRPAGQYSSGCNALTACK